MSKGEQPENIKKEIEKSKERKEKEQEVYITNPEQPIKGRALIWILLFGEWCFLLLLLLFLLS